jgi:membrane associated rhomboid family serine protease
MFILTWVLWNKGIDLNSLLGASYFTSPNFEPYQIVTYMFMHDKTGLQHILINMFMLVMFGAFLEKQIGAKKYFILYVSAGLGALVLYNAIGIYEIMQVKKALVNMNVDPKIYHEQIKKMDDYILKFNNSQIDFYGIQYQLLCKSKMVGASGALFGILAGFAVLFPNTELMLLFPPIPIKAKYLIGAYILFEIYSSFLMAEGDNVAHLAHVGGALVGIVMILIWRKYDRQNFY